MQVHGQGQDCGGNCGGDDSDEDSEDEDFQMQPMLKVRIYKTSFQHNLH